MNASSRQLISLEAVTKVFYTDEVETHALAGVHLEIEKGEYVSIADPSPTRYFNAEVTGTFEVGTGFIMVGFTEGRYGKEEFLGDAPSPPYQLFNAIPKLYTIYPKLKSLKVEDGSLWITLR